MVPIQILVALPRRVKQVLVVGVDLSLCVIAVWVSLALRLETLSVPIISLTVLIAISTTIAIPLFWFMGLYRAVIRHTGGQALRVMARAVLLYGIVFASFVTLVGFDGVPRATGIIQPMVVFVLLGGSRWAIRSLLSRQITTSGNDPRKAVLVFGAGEAGRQLALNVGMSSGWRCVGFLDDDDNLWGATVDGIRVYKPAVVSHIIKKFNVDEIWLAMPTVPQKRRREIIEGFRSLAIHVRTLPSLSDMASGKFRPSDIRELDILDLLDRDAVEPHGALLSGTVRGKTVMVTGAGGSIGSELCRQIVRLAPAKLVLVDHSEYALYAINSELLAVIKERLCQMVASGRAGEDLDLDANHLPVDIVPILASVTDEALIKKAFALWRPHTVIHAAAFKHVPMVEQNVGSALYNNIWGTYICATQALNSGARSFVLISTDKAVRPTNVMGVSKRLAEQIIQAIGKSPVEANCIFSAVRFGNVLDSSGSVVPLFRGQIASGGPVTVTHPQVTRYFMTIPEASQLVLQAASMARGGEIFVLDMGKPIKIYELALRMIDLAGLTVKDALHPEGDIEIEVTGLRPGEKLYEELLIGCSAEKTTHPKIMRALEPHLPLQSLIADLNELFVLLEKNDLGAARQKLSELVPEYVPPKEFFDWTDLAGNESEPEELPVSVHASAV